MRLELMAYTRVVRRSILSDEERTMTEALTLYDLIRTNDAWDLESGGKVIATFSTKSDAVQGQKMKRVIGRGGGTLRIHTELGAIEEERTYPDCRGSRTNR
jgi:hypothetical protein